MREGNDLHVLYINDAWTIIRLAQALSTAAPHIAKKKSLRITIGRSAFFEMNLVSYLLAYCLELKRAGIDVELTGEPSPQLYLARMDFNRHLGLKEPSFRRHSEEGRFIPIRLVNSDDDVKAAVDAICELAVHQFDNAGSFVPAMEWAVNEIVDNIRIHSNTKVPGVVCAQYYPEKHRLDIAICDMGIGIQESLSSSHDIVDAEDAVRNALSRGITRDPNVGQGNGMAGALTIAEANGGEFHVWTGDCLFTLKGGAQTFSTIPSITGTGVMFSLDTNHEVKLANTWIGDSGWSFINAISESVAEAGGIDVSDRCKTTGSRPPAKALRRWILSVLPELDNPLKLDFSKVKSASSSFLDELLGRLAKELGTDAFNAKIALEGMNQTLQRMSNVVIAQRMDPDSIKDKVELEYKPAASWLVRLDEEARFKGFEVTVDLGPSTLRGVHDGDAVVLSEEREGKQVAVGIGRIFRKRSGLDHTSFYFDGFMGITPVMPIEELGIPTPGSPCSVTRIDWPVFETALKKACKVDWPSFPVLSGETPGEQSHVRELMQFAIMDDLLGPADGPDEEIIGMSVRDRYLVGKLAPRETRYNEDDHLPGTSGENDPEEPGQDTEAATNQSLVPSSFGFTFCVAEDVENVEVEATWGRYERTESERTNEKTGAPFRCWKRIPSGGKATISLAKRVIEQFPVDMECEEVLLQGSVSAPLPNGDRLITLFLVNTQDMPDQNQDQAWVFQPELIVRDPEGRAIFQRRPILNVDGSDDERESLEMIYRNRVEFAVGHGMSVHATTADGDTQHAVEIRTTALPQYEVAVTETPGLEAEDRPAMRRLIDEGLLDMVLLAELERDELTSALTILTDDYAAWIEEQQARVGKDVKGYDKAANDALGHCALILKRLREGIDVLSNDNSALESFRFANQAMASQRVRSIYALLKRRGEEPDLSTIDIPKNRTWRPFQLAFVLLSVPALSNPLHKDRTEPVQAFADLLWFPTGGGKTEAYLGVAAFTMAIRRLQGKLGDLDASRGLAVIMRYTLRLLTIQQFQRATSLICAMEVLRKNDFRKWGPEPFTIGLWVGQKITPNSTQECHEAIERERDGKYYGTGSTPAQLTTCPWCGSEIAPGREIRVDREAGRTFIYCGDKFGKCEFSRSKSKELGLPIVVVDEEIYRRPPSMLIATVDKFAMMAWRGQVRTLFGRATEECDRHGLLWPEADCTGNHSKKGALPNTKVRQITPVRPPDLIIQDEFHLISGPLGTMVGLYETAVDELATWKLDGKAIRPKVIASTATVRKAEEQVNNVFMRRVAVFPPHGLDVEDNFFSVQRPVEKKPGRRYIGICALGTSRPAVLIRVYVALLTSAQSLFDRFGIVADPYMTAVGYFNSKRELGGMRRLSEDDVQTRSYRVQMSDVVRPGLSQRSVSTVDELTSRVSSKDIPKRLDQLETKFKKVWAKGEARAIDIMLATNMLSVGVDVSRLGLMAVNGQPKNTAEYIQATSRVGRTFPGLVCTVLTWSRPRDLSHYETFEHYHATFYKHVEAQSVTPFAPRALDRGLTGTMISLLRLDSELFNPNLGAQEMDTPTKPEVSRAKQVLSDRAWKVKDKTAKENSEAMIADRVDRWVKESVKGGRRLGYETVRQRGDVAPLLKKPGALAWDAFTVPLSMREVEPGVQLVMDVAKLSDAPDWKMQSDEDEQNGSES